MILTILDFNRSPGKNRQRAGKILDFLCRLAEEKAAVSDEFFLERISSPLPYLKQMAEKEMLQDRYFFLMISVDEFGYNDELCAFMCFLRRMPKLFLRSKSAMVVDGEGEMYTKSIARELAWLMNQAGCTFPGSPLVEANGSLSNFIPLTQKTGKSLMETYQYAASKLLFRFMEEGRLKEQNGEFSKNILCVHASNHRGSNTYGLWQLVKRKLKKTDVIEEIVLKNGTIRDCKGCLFETCRHFGSRGSCYYGGVIVDRVYPAIERCDALVLLCPNYNDALSANLTALINRLTALYRNRKFYDKYLFAVIVSGYSGGDILGQQLVSALNMNKTFRLPGQFVLSVTANQPGDVYKVKDVHERTLEFARRIDRTLYPHNIIKTKGADADD